MKDGKCMCCISKYGYGKNMSEIDEYEVSIYAEDKELNIYCTAAINNIPIEYCPKCGRKL